MNAPDKMMLQHKEFDAADAYAEALRRHNCTAVVDDDYPQVRHEYEGALAGLIEAMKANGRFDGANRYRLASPQGAEQRQEAIPVDLPWPDDSVDCTEPNRADCPRKCMDFCNKLESTPHPAQAASQGDESAPKPVAFLRDMLAELRLERHTLRNQWRIEALEVAIAAMSSPTGVQAAQVWDALRRIVAVMGPKVPACCQGCEWEWSEALRIANEALAQPGSAAHGGEARANNGDPDTIVPAPAPSKKRPPHA